MSYPFVTNTREFLNHLLASQVVPFNDRVPISDGRLWISVFLVIDDFQNSGQGSQAEYTLLANGRPVPILPAFRNFSKHDGSNAATVTPIDANQRNTGFDRGGAVPVIPGALLEVSVVRLIANVRSTHCVIRGSIY